MELEAPLIARHTPVMSVGIDGRIEDANPAARDALGFTGRQLLGRPVFDLYADSPSGKGKARQLFQRFRQGMPLERERLQMRRGDGTALWVLLSAEPIFDEVGRVVRSRSVLEVAETGTLPEDWWEIATSQPAMSLDRCFDPLPPLIVHELRNPLGTILLAAEKALALPQGDEAPHQQREALLQIRRESQRCARILRNLLRVVRGEAPDCQDIDLVAVAESAVDAVVHQAVCQETSLRVYGVAAGVRAWASFGEIEQAMVNLLENALQSCRQGGWIEISFEVRRSRARARVADNGRGIRIEDRPHLFEPTFSTRRQQGGSGLGLALARTLLLRNGGDLTLEATPGPGASFTLELPLAKPATGSPAPAGYGVSIP